MFRLFLLPVIICYSGASLFGQVPINQLVAWFPFNTQTIEDASLNGSIGTVFGQPELVCGVEGSAVRFDGQNDAILFLGPVNEMFTSSDFSVSFYFKRFSQPGTQLIMAKQDYTDCNSKPAFWVRYSFNSNAISSGLFQDDTASVTVSGKLDEDRCWQLVTLVRNVNKYSIFINGNLKDEATSVDRIKLNADDELLHVGEPVCPTDRWMKGDLDELRFYKRALTLAEIKSLDFRPDQIVNSDTLIFLGNSVQMLTTNSCATAFAWTPASGIADPSTRDPLVTPTESTTYKISFLDQSCIATDTVFVKVIDPSTLTCSEIFIPNAFTPGNSLGRNDQFGISNPFALSEFISFEIFDRWGGRVFSGTSALDQWDGNFNGNPVNPGSYLYRLQYKCDGEEKLKAGNVIVIR